MPKKRREEIYQYIKEKSEASIDELVDLNNVSSMTIRRDLNYLEEEGLITVVKNGAIIRSAQEFTFEERSSINYDKKLEIVKIASSYIKPGDTIMLDGSSTAYMISDFLPDEVIVVTNNLPLALNIHYHKENIEVIVIGGHLRKTSGTIVGSDAIKSVKNFHVDKVFLSSDSIDMNHGVTDKNMEEAAIKIAMLESAKESFFLMDSTKFGRKSLYKVCNISTIDNLIMNSIGNKQLAPKVEEHCKKNNINLLTNKLINIGGEPSIVK